MIEHFSQKQLKRILMWHKVWSTELLPVFCSVFPTGRHFKGLEEAGRSCSNKALVFTSGKSIKTAVKFFLNWREHLIGSWKASFFPVRFLKFMREEYYKTRHLRKACTKKFRLCLWYRAYQICMCFISKRKWKQVNWKVIGYQTPCLHFLKETWNNAKNSTFDSFTKRLTFVGRFSLFP